MIQTKNTNNGIKKTKEQTLPRIRKFSIQEKRRESDIKANQMKYGTNDDTKGVMQK